MDGNVECLRKACPVLPCPKTRTRIKPGACCPECIGSRKIFKVENRCLVDKTLYVNGEEGKLDKCTKCTCQNSTMVCEKKTCPTISCSPLLIKTSEDGCCLECIPQKNKEKQCVSSGVIRQFLCHFALWSESVVASPCPSSRRSSFKLHEDGVCTVFGDPHYQTFDGRIFNFQGSCKYLLTKDCRRGLNSTFMVKVRNDGRHSKYFSWTKTITIKIEDVKIALEQHMVVRVAHKRIKLPYVKPGVVTIEKDGYNVEVRSVTGVRIIWDGDSFLEVTVPAKYKKHLCGLCGNFNRKKRDDFLMKKGMMAKNIVDLGQSWRVGSKLKCGRVEPVYHKEPICQKEWATRVDAVKKCNALKTGVFKACHTTLSVKRFFQSCLMDMCECSGDHRCYCEALTAYSRACKRLGGSILDYWGTLKPMLAIFHNSPTAAILDFKMAAVET
ncbi:BMP-binding endothelial regulator protein [Nymphon striatum]|nr:BMP-binding endothelial regulator protein [Nymphon striatum]